MSHWIVMIECIKCNDIFYFRKERDGFCSGDCEDNEEDQAAIISAILSDFIMFVFSALFKIKAILSTFWDLQRFHLTYNAFNL